MKVESGFDDTVVTTIVLMIMIPGLLGTSVDLTWATTFFIWLTGSAIALGIAVGFPIGKLITSHDGPNARLLTLVTPFLAWITALSIASSPYITSFVAGMSVSWISYEREGYEDALDFWDTLFHLMEATAFVTLGAIVELERLFSLLPVIVTSTLMLFALRPIEVSIFTSKGNLKMRDRLVMSYMALKGLDPAALAVAVAAYVPGIGFLTSVVFGTILLLTIIQSIALFMTGWVEARRRF